MKLIYQILSVIIIISFIMLMISVINTIDTYNDDNDDIDDDLITTDILYIDNVDNTLFIDNINCSRNMTFMINGLTVKEYVDKYNKKVFYEYHCKDNQLSGYAIVDDYVVLGVRLT